MNEVGSWEVSRSVPRRKSLSFVLQQSLSSVIVHTPYLGCLMSSLNNCFILESFGCLLVPWAEISSGWKEMCGKSKEDKSWQSRSRDKTICYFSTGLLLGGHVFVSSEGKMPAFPLLEFSKGTANKIIF